MQWPRLLSPRRLGKDSTPDPIPGRSPFQQDFDRIIFSSAFRRLQDKTQVFPLAESDYVRTRLTHSLEAACVGRSLGTLAGVSICEIHRLADIAPSDIGAIVAAASLAHDIGNPPLGHSGEEAIRHWFANSQVAETFKAHMTPAQRDDIQRYEGNAQGFRVLARLQMPDNPGGMQLTCATLAAFTKYPVESAACGHSGTFSKKFNFFQAEKALFEEVAACTGMLHLESGGAAWVRHPLAFLVEAADDICYTIVDFEDGHSLGIIPYRELEEAFTLITGPMRKQDSIREDQRKAEFLRAMALNALVNQLAQAFIEHEQQILAGELRQSLTSIIPAAEALEKIKERSFKDVYTYRRAIEIEVAGYELFSGLLDAFAGSVADIADNPGNASFKSRKTILLLPEKFRPEALDDHYSRLMKVLDFICGMTDSYALSIYRKIKGISMPGL